MTLRHLATRIGATVLGITLLVPAWATAQTFIPGDQAQKTVGSIDALRSAVKRGDHVSVLQSNGVTIFGKVDSISGSDLTLVSEGLRFQLSVDTIRQVERWHRQAVRGLWIGTLVGAGLGAVLGAAGSSNGGEDYTGAIAFVGAIYGAGIGAVIGAFDRSGHEIVYAAPASKTSVMILPGGAGVRVAFRF